MKIRYCTVVVAALLTAACTHTPVMPEFSDITIDTLIGERPFDCNVSYRFASITNAQKSPALQAIESANINYFFELQGSQATANQAALLALNQIASEIALPANRSIPTSSEPAWGPGEISAESEGRIVDTLLSYMITRSSFTGGAHGSYSTECHTYLLKDGREIKLSDLFSTQMIARLDTAIRTKLYQRYDAVDDNALAEQGFFPENIGTTANFHVTPEGIIFCYNPYEIGCYALGAVEVMFSREELELR